MTSSYHTPYVLGDTHVTVAETKGYDPAMVSLLQKPVLSSNFRLQLTCMKPKSLVTDQHSFLNLVCTAQYIMGVVHAQSRYINYKEGAVNGSASD